MNVVIAIERRDGLLFEFFAAASLSKSALASVAVIANFTEQRLLGQIHPRSRLHHFFLARLELLRLSELDQPFCKGIFDHVARHRRTRLGNRDIRDVWLLGLLAKRIV